MVDVIVEDARWEAVALETLAETAVRATLRHLGLAPAGFEVALMAGSDARIAELNAEFRDKPAPTNVLSWPARDMGAPEAPDTPVPGPADDPEPLGDIALAWDTCAAEARAAGRPLADHLTHLVVHATLHLLGYDHAEDTQAAVMESLEVAILAQLGLPDPYGDVAGERIA
ncbi:rRNA maturation RNase YbeY [Rhodobaculum claviforme]|uniref:Endoribonuclease YbeY n=1 Tax=Rhodobaculum claviforme TaxID=1549854 RepID=A0A934WHR7_9RHOB|nr:rRNA maturation RNase YbeY [Rhodobaculum claviforme]